MRHSDVDFTAEVERSVRVLDGAVTIIDAVSGAQAQTQTVWSQAERYGVPRIVFVNKMDRDGASVSDAMESIRTRLHATPVLTQLPIGAARTFAGVIDLLNMTEMRWDAESLGVKYAVTPIDPSDSLFQVAKEARSDLCEQVAELDDALMEHLINNSITPVDIGEEELRQAIRRITLQNKAVPVLLGSSLRNIGVQPVMDAVIDYLPSPLERTPPVAYKSLLALEDEVNAESTETASPASDASHSTSRSNEITLDCDPKKPLVAQAFKVVHEQRTNSLVVYVRVYSGTMTSGMRMQNTTRGKEERSLRMTRVRAERLEDLKELHAGDIGAVTGLKNTSTGDTLVGQKDPGVCVRGMRIPEPVFYMSILADSVAEEEPMRHALNLLQLEDPSFKWMINKDTGQWLLCGMGELHLEILKDRLFTYYKVKAATGDIQIAYKSSIKEDISDHWIKSYAVASGRMEEVNFKIDLENLESNEENDFEIAEGVVMGLSSFKKARNELLPALTEAASDMFRSGIPAGYPLANTKITLSELVYNPNTSAHTYKLALMEAIFQSARQAGVQILEPIMRVELTVEDEYAGGVLSDLTSKRNGVVEQVQHGGPGKKLILADVPLKDLMGYSTELRSLSKGTGGFIMEFDHNGPVTEAQQTKILGTTYFN